MKRISAYILLLALWGCIYPYDADLPESESPSLVIEGNIRIGDISEVTLSYVFPLDRVLTHVVPNGTGYIEDNRGNRYNPDNSFSTGNHLVFNTEKLKYNQKYRLVIEADGETYTSTLTSPTVSPTIQLSTVYADGLSVFISSNIDASECKTPYIAVRYDEVWQFHSDYIKMYEFDPEWGVPVPIANPDMTHYWCWNTNKVMLERIVDLSNSAGLVNNLGIISFARTDNRNHNNYKAKIHVRSVTEEEYRYRNALASNSNSNGSLFSPNPGELISNITCESSPSKPVYGYVNVFMEDYDYVFLDNKYYIEYQRNLLILEEEQYMSYYRNGYSPVSDYLGRNGMLGIGWGTARCYDCVAAGGTLTRPDL